MPVHNQPIHVSEESICRACAQFWEQMLAMHLDPLESATSGARCIGPKHIVGYCDVAGVWKGRIEVRLAPGLATAATSAMRMHPGGAVESGEMMDAAKEIANMIAGAIKSALPRPCTMTVPGAEFEAADFCIPAHTSDSVSVFFQHESGQLMIRVWQPAQESSREESMETADAERFAGELTAVC